MIEQFIEDVLKEKGLPPDIDPAVRQQMVSDLSDRALNLINKRLVDALPDDKVSELEKLIDANPDDKEVFSKFIDENVPDKQQVVTLALSEFRSLYLGIK